MTGLRRLLLAAALCFVACSVQGDRKTRVVGGKKTNIQNAPWLAQLMYKKESGETDNSLSCAGVVVDELHVLTAAHCFPKGTVYRKSPEKSVHVNVGATYKLFEGDVYLIKSVALHPRYLDASRKYDLAVITLTAPMRLSKAVKPIALADQEAADGAKVVSGGWGSTQLETDVDALSPTPVLMTVDMTKQPRAWCDEYLADTDLDTEDRNALLCMKPKKDMLCTGDGGAGAWIPARGGRPAQLVGLLLGAASCDALDGVPLFVDVLHPDVRDFLVSAGVLQRKQDAAVHKGKRRKIFNF